MTVIVWDGKTLAADSRCSDDVDGHLVYRRGKIRKIGKDCWIGFAGGWSDIEHVYTWVKEGSKPKKKPKVDNFAALMVKEGRGYLCDEGLIWIPIDYGSVGSGRTIANVALYLGKTAIEAAETACAMDPRCDGPVQSVSMDNL